MIKKKWWLILLILIAGIIIVPKVVSAPPGFTDLGESADGKYKVHKYTQVGKEVWVWASKGEATSVGMSCLIELEYGDHVNLQIENEQNNKDIEVHTVNLDLHRIGET